MSKLPLIWEWDVGESFCVLTSLQNVEDEYELAKGVPRAKGFPANACFHMDPKFKKFVALADNISNLGRIIVVSKPLKELIESWKPREVEYLQVSIINHKKKVASDEYFIVNPLRVVDCIDKDKSDITWNKIDSEKISACEQLVLKPRAINSEFPLFRLRHFEHAVMVDRKLAQAILDEGFTGARFEEVDEFVR
ncbi:imm11 family protein [Archangium violaceum]|uniref:Immunity MXAN-0049 protein domain-containing protein n=1 Tax=Archangium violaceum Cb vi76 TaxID=1406225 RepID=A0A084T110_9BACT|nr:DUF1629 domain-containing protein [Archangium violaceum]KFA94395.1 hypothetical protein Q664_02950 [Archangium violaceum Cb vi76]